MTRAIRPALLASATLLLAACASSDMPSFGDSLLHRSAQQEALARQWHDGAELLAEGNDNVRDGQKKIARGQQLLDEGRRQLEQGQAQVAAGTLKQQESVAAYEKMRANPIPLPGAAPAPAAQ